MTRTDLECSQVEYAEKQMIADADKALGNESTSSLSGSDRGFVQPARMDNSSSDDDDDHVDAAPDDLLVDLAKEQALVDFAKAKPLVAGQPTTKDTANGVQILPQNSNTGTSSGPHGPGFDPRLSGQSAQRTPIPPPHYVPPLPPSSAVVFPNDAFVPLPAQVEKTIQQAPPPPVNPSPIVGPAPVNPSPVVGPAPALTSTDSPVVKVRKTRQKREHSPASRAAMEAVKRRRLDCKDMLAAVAEYDIRGVKELLSSAIATTSAARAGQSFPLLLVLSD